MGHQIIVVTSVMSIKTQDDRIVVIHKKNGGLSAARNTGFYVAKGEWITFVDGDDWIEYNMCEVMYHKASQANVQLIMCSFSKDYGKTSNIYKINLEENKIYYKKECHFLQSQLLKFNGNIAIAYAKLIKRSFLIDNHIVHDEVLRQGGEGIEFNFRLFDKLERAVFVNQSFYHYMYNPSSISASFDEKNNQYALNCFIKIKGFIETSDNKEMLLKNFYNRLVYVIVTTAISGYFNPENRMDYNERVMKYKNYLRQSLIQETIKKADLENIPFVRKITFNLIKHGNFMVVNIIAHIRKKQLMNK